MVVSQDPVPPGQPASLHVDDRVGRHPQVVPDEGDCIVRR